MQLGQRLQLATSGTKHIVPESKGVVKVWDRGDVGENHLYDLWEVVDQFVRGGCLWRRITEQAIDVGLGSMPNGPHLGRKVYPYSANGAEVRAIYA